MKIKATVEKWKLTIKRWVINLRWLFNHPITNFTNLVPAGVKCDYCGSSESFVTYLWSNGLRSTVCWTCIFKALDLVLKPTK